MEINKHQKTKHSQQCIGPCYPPGSKFIHPNSLKTLTNTEKNSNKCPTNEWFDNPTKKWYETDICYNQSTNDDIKQMEGQMLVPSYIFTPEKFLKLFYNIDTFDQSITWYFENANTPLSTRLRILESSLVQFGKQLDYISDDFVNVYIDIAKKLWINDIYKNIHQYIYINEKDEEIFLKKNKEGDKQRKIEKINYIIKKFLTKQNIFDVLKQYIFANKKEWDHITAHNELIKKELIRYIDIIIKSSI